MFSLIYIVISSTLYINGEITIQGNGTVIIYCTDNNIIAFEANNGIINFIFNFI